MKMIPFMVNFRFCGFENTRECMNERASTNISYVFAYSLINRYYGAE